MKPLSSFPSGTCPNCGGPLLGDGYTVALHCENAEDIAEIEPDAEPVFCESEEDLK